MPIFDQHKCIFVHIPKCAGTSISNVFSDGHPIFSTSNYDEFSLKYMKGRNLEHSTAKKIRLLAPFRFRRYFKFAFVRNPFDRMVSEYKWRKTWDDQMNEKSFSDMLKDIPVYRKQKKPHFFTAKSFLTDRRGNLIVDYIGKFENIDNDFEEIAKRIGIAKTLPKKNVTASESQKFSDYYDDETKQLVMRYFSEDFEYLSYSTNI
uniref:sulfotransferase family 2 domain-containing protein n=1 Tax=Ningiella ruwaisensis TaxID=2364274 RepID=UPI00109FE22F|nr:sulfotransferase family 2 domain-containing protein [Ningiella ruwaisensis]